MSDFVIMPKEHWQNTCDAVREKSGSSELILSGDMAAAVAAIEAGGGEDWEDFFLNRTATSYSNNTVTAVGDYALAGFANLQSLELTQAVTLGKHACSQNPILRSVSLPLATSLGDRIFYNCSELESVSIPCVTKIGSYGFANCSFLYNIDLPAVTSIGANAFTYCDVLEIVILRSASMCTLSAANAFSSTPIKDGRGYIYVPRALVDTYKVNSVWSTYANQFRAIEDYPDICGG